MTRAYIQLGEGVTFDTPKGGKIRSGSSDVMAPSAIHYTQTGVSFGPLYVGIPDGGSVCTLDRVAFLPDDDDGDDGFLIFGITAGGSSEYVRRNSGNGEPTAEPPDDELSATRRSMLALAVTIIGAALAGGRVAAQNGDDLVALNIAEIDISKLDSPITIRVLDVIDDVLPPSTEIMVDADEARVGEIGDPSEGVTMPAETTGTVSIYLRDSMGKLDRLLAWAKGIGGDEEITFARELDQKASKYDEGKFITLTEHPALVEPVRESGPSETVLTVGNTVIPHQDDGASEAGSYGVFEDSLIYELGPNPPASAAWELQTRLGTLAAIRTKYLKG